MRRRLDLRSLVPWWRPMVASLLTVGAAAATLGGFGRVFFAEAQSAWTATQGGALFGLGLVGFAWAIHLATEWCNAPQPRRDGR